MSVTVHADREIEARWLHDPIAPCCLMPNGGCGLLLVEETGEHSRRQASTTYAVTLLGRYKRREKVLELFGVRLLAPGTGETRDIDLHADGGPACDCPDFLARPRKGGCRHLQALRLAGLPELETIGS